MESLANRPWPETEPRPYRRAECVVFRKTHEQPFGGLSNMAAGFPLSVNGHSIRTAEALYQACRFPHLPDVQRHIIEQKSPMAAKMESKPHRKDTRLDWDEVRVPLMRWCLRVKLAQNWQKFSGLLEQTGDKLIVEESRRDRFWGAVVVGESTLVGVNMLGRLLVELRQELRGPEREALRRVEPLDIPDFLLYGEPIRPVEAPSEDGGPIGVESAPGQQMMLGWPDGRE